MAESKNNELGLLKWSVGLLLLTLLAFAGSEIVFIGPILISLAPNFLLLGLLLLFVLFAKAFIRSGVLLWLLVALAVPLIALNTRIPTLAKDLLAVEWRIEKIGIPLQATRSQPIRLQGEENSISARKFAYDSARPSCYGDGCFITRGFRTPLPHLGYDYWSENPKETILEAGLALAKPDEITPTLDISTAQDGLIFTVRLKLSDSGGNLISSATYKYRNGFPQEPKDDSASADLIKTSPKLALNYMAHGNFINGLIGRVVAPEVTFPIKSFISRSISLTESPLNAGKIGRVQLETLEQKIFDPALLVKGVNQESAKDPWPEKGWDEERYKFCDNVLKRESPQAQGGMVQVWWVFVQDTTGRIKIRRTSNELCDEQYVWSFDYAAQRPGVVITKYSVIGELQYQVTFQRPPEIYGYQGGIRQKSFHESDGYVYFEWMDVNRPGYDLEIKRNLSVRFLVPKAGVTAQ